MAQSNTEEFVKFVNDAANAVTDEGTPVLQIGDLLVADNASIHRFEAVKKLWEIFLKEEASSTSSFQDTLLN